MSDWKVTIEVIGSDNVIEVKTHKVKTQRSAESLKEVLKLKVEKIKKMEKHLGISGPKREVWIYPPKGSAKAKEIIRNRKLRLKNYVLSFGTDLKREMLDYPTFCRKWNDKFHELQVNDDENDVIDFLEDCEKAVRDIVAEL